MSVRARKPTKSSGGPQIDWPPAIRRRYKAAFERLYRDLGRHRHVIWLEQQLVVECEEARAARGRDPHAAKRQQDREALARGKALSKAAREIASYMREFPHAGGFIGAGALLSLRESGLGIALKPRGGGKVAIAEALAGLCEQLDISAAAHNPAGRGPWAWRFSIPGAMYETAIDDRTKNRRGPPDMATVLAFHLIMWIRRVTTSEPFVVCNGMPMPRGGRPHYRVAEAFIAAALGDEIDAAERIKANSKLRYFSW